MWELRIGNVVNSSIFISVFHRILDFKNGAEFLFRPLYFFSPSNLSLGLIRFKKTLD
jgi:hypothetical protein